MPGEVARSHATVRLCPVSPPSTPPDRLTPPDVGGAAGPASAADDRSVERGVPDRRTELAWALSLLVLVAAGGLVLARGSNSSWLDTLVPGFLTSGHHSVLTDVTSLRYPQVVVAASVVLAVVAFRRDRVRSLVCLVGPPVALVTTELVVKPLVGRTLGAGLSYPSGSTVGAAALGVAAVLAVPAAWRRRTIGVAVVYGLWMALAVVSLQWHYPTDAAAGLAFGCGTMLLVDVVARNVGDALQRVGIGRHAVDSG
jgi:membrane-associated phospholipid phosphatase